jgi:WD40 repeat protein
LLSDPNSGGCLEVLQYKDDSDNSSIRWLGVQTECGWLEGIGTDNAIIYIWDINGNKLQQMMGIIFVSTVAWSMFGTPLASGGYGKDRGELVIWDLDGGDWIQRFDRYSANINGVVWGLNDNEPIAGYIDGRLCWMYGGKSSAGYKKRIDEQFAPEC